MATENELQRWGQVFDRILIPYDSPMSAVRMLAEASRPFPHTQAVGVAALMLIEPLTAAWDADPPPKGSELSEWIGPAYAAAKSINLSSTELGQFVEYIELVRQARDRIAGMGPENFTLESVLRDLELDFKLAVLVARLGHNGILQLIDRRIVDAGRAARREESPPAPNLDLLRLEATETSNYRTMSYSDIRAMADPGVMTLEEYLHGDPEAERAPILKYFAAQWVTHMTTLWDEHYRPNLAALHGCEKIDVASDLFADLNKMRQDYVHNRGWATAKQAKNKRLRWFEQGDSMIPTGANYEQLFKALQSELDLLAQPPVPKDKPNRTSVKGQVPIALRSLFEQTAAAVGLGTDAALEDALTKWVQARQQG
ncbi:hypothetical protein [Mycobacterium sp. 1245805.9]|uniref:hypothetical protein n=1 Tax=Mycobacterium sp. 1245805.9 TaxID=1856862 RepID=UPI000800C7C6|nr:hypothetical protein [Mycobacterium sp. 1245805.9]OBI86049.1 hypothetical protein A9X00_26440 [Mycobacterium sp. 1245805.9]